MSRLALGMTITGRAGSLAPGRVIGHPPWAHRSYAGLPAGSAASDSSSSRFRSTPHR